MHLKVTTKQPRRQLFLVTICCKVWDKNGMPLLRNFPRRYQALHLSIFFHCLRCSNRNLPLQYTQPQRSLSHLLTMHIELPFWIFSKVRPKLLSHQDQPPLQLSLQVRPLQQSNYPLLSRSHLVLYHRRLQLLMDKMEIFEKESGRLYQSCTQSRTYLSERCPFFLALLKQTVQIAEETHL
jgi:hypothetical protein